ncbi:MAG: DNA-3-methyladenine glycosylase 2 family protein [Cyanobacteria bacterium SZAS LIN-2]|nr:DNA-3-methyladenine glycosylase 2 family protein [Cyanobacteria bacterium SZAS LIN-2]
MEAVAEDRYWRTARVGEHCGWFCVELGPELPAQSLVLKISPSLAPVRETMIERARHLFDVQANVPAISLHLGELAAPYPGLRIAGAFDGMELAVRTILGQQVSVKAGNTMTGRVARRFGRTLKITDPTAPPGLELLMPDAATLAGAQVSDFTELGIIARRAETIIAVARAVADDDLQLVPHADEVTMAETLHRLKSIPGIGDWTAQYLAIRVFRAADAFPAGDLALRKALKLQNSRDPRGQKEALAAVERFRPWRSYAAMHLWKSVAAD